MANFLVEPRSIVSGQFLSLYRLNEELKSQLLFVFIIDVLNAQYNEEKTKNITSQLWMFVIKNVGI